MAPMMQQRAARADVRHSAAEGVAAAAAPARVREMDAPMTSFLNRIEQNRNAWLLTPFFLVVFLWVLSLIGGSEVRNVLDSMSPSNFLGR